MRVRLQDKLKPDKYTESCMADVFDWKESISFILSSGEM